MKNNKLKVACLVATTMILPVSQAVVAGEATWGLSGWINEGITYYDDGENSDVAQLSDNGTTLGSRLTFSGTYKPDNTGITAGFEVIIEPTTKATPLLSASQADLDADGIHLASGLTTLSHNIHIGGEWGKVTIGTQSMPTDNIAVLADPSVTIWSGISPLFRANGFLIQDITGANTTWGSFASCLATPGLGIGIDCNGVYRSGVRYDLPAMGPVSVAVGWANDDIYDIALKYAGEFGGLKANLNVGYSYNANGGVAGLTLDGSETFQVQLGLMDPETGVFGTVSYQAEEAETSSANAGDDTDAYYIKAGIKTAMNSMGDTALYVEYASYNDQFGNGQADGITGSKLERVGIVAEQYFGSRLLVYGKYEQYSLDVSGTNIYDDAEDLDLATVGVTFFF